MLDRYDHIVIGAGSAGCVLASRLSEDSSRSVLLLEAGGRDRQQEIHIPAAFSKLFKTEVDWAYETEPQEELAGRRLFWPRGKVLGGSSSINAMIYIRGHRGTYDEWARLGNAGWSYDELLPYFKKSEDHFGGASAFHGAGGPLRVSELRDPNPLSEAFVEAALETGASQCDDFNGADQLGVGLYQVTQKRGKRCSAAVAFLRPAMSRPNLTVRTHAQATRIRFEGQRAVGVDFLHQGRPKSASGGEITLCGGAINSPQLLLLSGVGPAAQLEEHGIPVVLDSPGVGENLRDHLIVILGFACQRPITLASAESLGSVARYLIFRRGHLSSNVGEAGGFFKTQDGIEIPDLQYHFAPSYFEGHGFDNPETHGFSIGPTLVQPGSVGRLSLKSKDPIQAPALEPRYFSDPSDLDLLVEGVRRALGVVAASAFDDYRGEPIFEVDAEDEDSINNLVRRQAETLYHPVGTCKMGNDPMAVVDAELRVHGVEGLRVADASIMPTITNGNTNAPAILIGEKAADLIRG